MKIDMSSPAITKRLRILNELRRTCLSLANTEAGREIMKKFLANQSVQRTVQSLGR